MRALPGDTEFFGDMRDRTPGVDDAFDQQRSPANGESGINVRQENLLASG